MHRTAPPHKIIQPKMSVVPKLRTPCLSESKADFVVLQSIQHLDRQGNTDEIVKVWLGAIEDEGT